MGSGEALAREVLDIDQANYFLDFIEDNEIVDAVLAKDLDDLYGKVIFLNGDGCGRHVVGDGAIANLAVVLVSANEVSVGEDPGKGVVGVDDDSCSGAALQHGQDGFLDGSGDWDFGECFAGAHDICDAGEEVFS